MFEEAAKLFVLEPMILATSALEVTFYIQFVCLPVCLSICQRYYILQMIEHYNDDKLTNIYQDLNN